MAEEGGNAPVIIIKKVQGGGHGGHHGGSWKVAFADFMTAMMAFFLVMWLMGSDDEVKASIADFFNNPSSPWRKPLQQKEVTPIGDKTAAGESVLRGTEGSLPPDMVQRPEILFYHPFEKEPIETDEMPVDYMEGAVSAFDMDLQILKFTIAERLLFEPGTGEFSEQSAYHLEKLRKLVKKFKGQVSIMGEKTFYDQHTEGDATDPYELAMARVVSVSSWMTSNRLIDQDRLKTGVMHSAGDSERTDSGQFRKIHFTFRKGT